DSLLDLSRLDVVERLAGRIGEILKLLVEADPVEQFLIGGIERRGGHVFARRAFLIAERVVDMGERLVRVEAVGISLDGKFQFFFSAVEVALFEKVLGFVEMLLRLGLASTDYWDRHEEGQQESARDSCSHRVYSFRRFAPGAGNPDEPLGNGAKLSRRWGDLTPSPLPLSR